MDSQPRPLSSEPVPDKNQASQPVSKSKTKRGKRGGRGSKGLTSENATVNDSAPAAAIPTKPKTESQVPKRKRKHKELDSVMDDADTTMHTTDGGEATPAQHETKRERKKRRKQEQEQQNESNNTQNQHESRADRKKRQKQQKDESSVHVQTESKAEKKQQKNGPDTLVQRTDGMKHREQQNVDPKWKTSDAIGGLFADIPPLFSADEEHLLLVQAGCVKVYATATSMLVGTCSPGASGISSICLSAQDPKKIYLLLKDSSIELWDWTIAQRLKTLSLGAKILDIAVSTTYDDSEAFDVVFTLTTWEGQFIIQAHYLNEDEHKHDIKVLYQDTKPIRAIRTLDHARFIVATDSKSVLVGSRIRDDSIEGEKPQYSFYYLQPPKKIVCSDVRVNTPKANEKTGHGRLDIVVGLEDGSLWTYFDAGSVGNESKEKRATPTNTKLHWHRNAVGSVAWAMGGNYIISGGQETVLVLWQLDTNTTTTIPHLTSAIRSIAVSPRGTSYAIHQADNSVMILGTQDFTSIFHVAGIGLPSVQNYNEGTLKQRLPSRRIPVAGVSSQPPRLISAVPSDMLLPRHRAKKSSGFHTNTNLQSTLLSGIGSAMSKQALVENNATTFRTRPDGHQLVSPNVVLIAVDNSGTWLSTVDEWYQPLNDISPNSGDPKEAVKTQLATVRVNLVFWLWNEETNSWTSSTRIPYPHADDDESSHYNPLVLDLIAAPVSAAFWTFGANGRIKHWAPRKQEGLGSRASNIENKTASSIWKCTKSINVPYASNFANSGIPSGRIVMTKDGSVFAVSWMTSRGSEVIVFTLLPDETTRQVFTYKLHHQAVSIAFLNQWFVIADYNSVLVRKLTDSATWFNAALESDLAACNTAVAPHLAIDDERQVFAVSLAMKESKGIAGSSKDQSKIFIFSTSSSNPIATFDQQPAVAALLSVPLTSKFYVLTTGAEIYSIAFVMNENSHAITNGETSQDNSAPLSKDKTSNTLGKIFGVLKTDLINADEEDNTMETESLRKKIAWNNIPGLNLDQPFALPKTSVIQGLSAQAIGV